MSNDLDRDLREMFHRHEGDLLGRPGTSPPNLVRRVRSRQVRNALAAGLVAAVIALGATAGLDSLLRADEPRPADTDPNPRPSPPPTLVIPPEGAEPSTPLTGKVVMRFEAQNIAPCGWCFWYLYEDGRLITAHDEPWDTFEGGYIAPYVEQRLTPRGIELMRDLLLSSPRLASGHGVGRAYNYFFARLSDGGRTSSISWRSGDGSDLCSGSQCWGFDDPIFARMVDPASWLPDSAWADRRIRAYVPSGYVVYGDPVVHPLALAPPADTLLEAVGCQFISTDEARELLDGFEAAGLLPTDELPDPAGIEVVYERNRGVGYLSFGPALPHSSC